MARLPVLSGRAVIKALGASLEVRLVDRASPTTPISAAALVERLTPLFWDARLSVELLDVHPEWVLGRVLTLGEPAHVAAARQFFGDDAIRRAIRRRDVDARTRNYWKVLLEAPSHAPQGSER